MAEGEKVTLQKWLSGFVNPVTNAKNTQFVVWLALIVLAGFTIWKAFFAPTNSQHQSANLVALPGSTVHYSPQQQQETKKRAWWVPSPFAEGYGFAESDGRNGVGGRVGARWEF